MFLNTKSHKIFQNLFLQHFGHELTQDQSQLFTKTVDFLTSSNHKAIQVISGYAGTGKTSFIGSLIKTLSNIKVRTVLLAPTGRAAKVLSRFSNKNAFTIHRIIYSSSDGLDGNYRTVLSKNTFKNCVFIVDECSMIPEFSIEKNGQVGRGLLEDLIEFVYSGENCKLIFIGDVGQLPPVGSSLSPALDENYLKFHFPFFEIIKVHLGQVMRQSEYSGILVNATKLRMAHSEIKFELNDFEDIIRINGLELQEIIEQSYDVVGSEDTILITKSNKRANEFNKQIRNRILWRDDYLHSNDDLMIVKNNYYWGQKTKGSFLANGELVRVDRIGKREQLYGFDFVHVTISLIDQEDESLETILLIESLDCEGSSLQRERLKTLFFEIEKDYSHIKSKSKRYAEIMRNPYFNALQAKFAYAVTCHKSQGGQWKNVLIDFGFMTPQMIDEDYKRWLYTALTRASEKVWLLNFPDYFFEDEKNHSS
ncbi:MAG: ATP-dependent endonuclease [Bacteroidetes bacterium]|nr:ATP-dependent endonuclease [Bacteroidota bacterium]